MILVLARLEDNLNRKSPHGFFALPMAFSGVGRLNGGPWRREIGMTPRMREMF